MDAISNLLQQCAPLIDARLASSLVRQESGFNPYAIGLDGRAVLKPQPRSLAEAIQKVKELTAKGITFSVGYAQIHVANVRSAGLTWEQAFDPCTNLSYGQSILVNFHRAAHRAGWRDGDAVFAALRGYNSGKIGSNVSNKYASEILSRLWGPVEAPPSFEIAQVPSQASGPQVSKHQERKPPPPADTNDIFASGDNTPTREKTVVQNHDIFND